MDRDSRHRIFLTSLSFLRLHQHNQVGHTSVRRERLLQRLCPFYHIVHVNILNSYQRCFGMWYFNIQLQHNWKQKEHVMILIFLYDFCIKSFRF